MKTLKFLALLALVVALPGMTLDAAKRPSQKNGQRPNKQARVEELSTDDSGDGVVVDPQELQQAIDLSIELQKTKANKEPAAEVNTQGDCEVKDPRDYREEEVKEISACPPFALSRNSGSRLLQVPMPLLTAILFNHFSFNEIREICLTSKSLINVAHKIMGLAGSCLRDLQLPADIFPDASVANQIKKRIMTACPGALFIDLRGLKFNDAQFPIIIDILLKSSLCALVKKFYFLDGCIHGYSETIKQFPNLKKLGVVIKDDENDVDYLYALAFSNGELERFDCSLTNAVAYTHFAYHLSRPFDIEAFDPAPEDEGKKVLSFVDRQGNTILHTVARELGSLAFKPIAKCFFVHFPEIFSMQNAEGQAPWNCAHAYDDEHGLPRQYPDLD